MYRVFLNRSIYSVFFVVILFSCNSSLSQLTERRAVFKQGYNYANDYGFGEGFDSGIRNSPITNREYLIFLCWNIEVYGDSYPEYVLELFPNNTINKKNISETPYNRKDYSGVFSGADGVFRDYILNTYYLDYPLIGLTSDQLERLYRWLSDRYNENLLVKIKYLNWNSEQKDEDSFSLEAFLSGQYQGDVKYLPKPKWEDNLLLPQFRPPFEGERCYTKKIRYRGKIVSPWRAYKFTKSNFLKLWNDYYISKKQNGIELNLPYGKEIILSHHQIDSSVKEIYHGYCIENKDLFFSTTKYLDQIENREKDVFGKMPFSIIGENTYGRPIVVENIDFEEKRHVKRNIYWLVYDKEIELRSWP